MSAAGLEVETEARAIQAHAPWSARRPSAIADQVIRRAEGAFVLRPLQGRCPFLRYSGGGARGAYPRLFRYDPFGIFWPSPNVHVLCTVETRDRGPIAEIKERLALEGVRLSAA